MSAVKEFGSSEWAAFSGAEAFGDGSPPLYAETLELLGWPGRSGPIEGSIIADRIGVQVQGDGADDDGFLLLDTAEVAWWTPRIARALIEELLSAPAVDVATLVTIGFQHCNFPEEIRK